MSNPVLVEVTRGDRVESRHRGSVAVSDAGGDLVIAIGDVETPVFPRSAIKVFQAIPLVESGAADRFGFGSRELSLACASHSGEPAHTELAAELLARAGLGERDLECGCHWPSNSAAARDLARAGGSPTQLHNNCSGKHTGFLCTAVHMREATGGYVEPHHPVQARARDVIADLTGFAIGPGDGGTDGCSIPAYAAPLAAFARGFAKLVSGVGVGAERAAAGRRLIEASMAEPWYMAGTGRACVELMQAAPGRVFAKTGAEGVFCGAVPELGLGFALKIDDGASRAAEAVTAAVLDRLFSGRDEGAAAGFRAQARKVLRNWRGVVVGDVEAALP